ncbi:MAG: glycosyltransferase family 2 protein, partial [Dokdonia donghaensis]|nr:glycosyltransferase family 2 protein [Dokdonia donghaensis]
YKRGRKASILDLIIKPTWIFIRSYIIRMGFLDGRNGFILCTFSAKTTYLKYCKLRRLRL